MNILILAPANNIHTQRWVISLAKYPLNICLFSLEQNTTEQYAEYPNIRVESSNFIATGTVGINRLRYLRTLPRLKKIIKEFKPNIVHAHYASSYGLLGALANSHPYILSVWGSDVYDFPKISFLHRSVLKYVLRKADKILSTSHIMAKETQQYTSKEISVTPFGVDTSLFKKLPNAKKDECFVVGNVKTLSAKYGIDILIKAFNILVLNNSNRSLRLDILGQGPDRNKLEALVQELGLTAKVRFLGFIRNSELPQYYNSFSVAASLSVWNSESFGVVAVEAMACECPVITSDADGFTEVVDNNVTGIIVPKYDVAAAAAAMQRFLNNPDLTAHMGEAGRRRVINNYDWSDNVKLMYNIYQNVINNNFNPCNKN